MDFKAIDRHMLGLKLIALENGMPVPEIFRDKAFGYAMHFRLSTSQVLICFLIKFKLHRPRNHQVTTSRF